MCGIFGIFNSTLSPAELRTRLIACSSSLRHRGPDWSGYHLPTAGGSGIAHERLAIIDPESGSQPIRSLDGRVTIAVNGEIYNYKELYKSHSPTYNPQTGSDCEVLLPLYLASLTASPSSPPFPSLLRGMFSFIIHDEETGGVLIVRDHIGITPLYVGWGEDGSLYVGSEMKALSEHVSISFCYIFVRILHFMYANPSPPSPPRRLALRSASPSSSSPRAT